MEHDPLILSLLRKFSTPLTELELTDERVEIHRGDGRLLLKTTSNTFDVMFLGITEPANLQANRFFTQEFFSLAEKRLNEKGILIIEVPGSLTLINEELKDLNSNIFHTLESVFSHIRVIPGEGSNVFLSSMSSEIAALGKEKILERLGNRDISAEVMVPRHIENKLHRGCRNWFTDFIEGGTQKINHDFKPLGVFYSLSYWNALYAPFLGRVFRHFERITVWGIAIVVLFMLLVYFFVVIFAFQSLYGYVFAWMGLLVASFMAGAAGGAMLISRRLVRIRDRLKLFSRVEQIIACFALGLPFLLFAGKNIATTQTALNALKILFLVIPFLCGFVTGSQFPLGNALYLKHNPDMGKTTGMLYASDLLGGWAGGIIGGVVLLPVLGLTGTCITVGLLKLASFIVFSRQYLHARKQSPDPRKPMRRS